jgi:hypothetical protein
MFHVKHGSGHVPPGTSSPAVRIVFRGFRPGVRRFRARRPRRGGLGGGSRRRASVSMTRCSTFFAWRRGYKGMARTSVNWLGCARHGLSRPKAECITRASAPRVVFRGSRQALGARRPAREGLGGGSRRRASVPMTRCSTDLAWRRGYRVKARTPVNWLGGASHGLSTEGGGPSPTPRSSIRGFP